MSKIILDLCGGTGSWSEPYRNSQRYDVRTLDILDGNDIRLFEIPDEPVYGILAAPPCTHFASSGARWFEEKGENALLEGLSVVDACIRIIYACRPYFWALENPIGRLKLYLGKPRYYFDPCFYGDAYTKRTCLWGEFNIPKLTPVYPSEGSKMHLLPPSEDRWKKRSATPKGFVRAFFEANQ
jgi:hypothetical protein